jgi:hypothetical protein
MIWSKRCNKILMNKHNFKITYYKTWIYTVLFKLPILTELNTLQIYTLMTNGIKWIMI